MKKTEWYPVSVKPVRRGLYEIKGARRAVYFLRWNGSMWLWPGGDGDKSAFGSLESDKWRGLTEPQE